ncbi:MAG: aminodeoxychorismate lyase [Gammaproteobacteria bacterium]|nr:aminodeoxychorismate lyase [Gammaproteobacteria bacterium]
MPDILINGKQASTLSVTDRGLHYGDGLFETVAIKHGRPCLLPQHLERLQYGCERLNMPMPDSETLTQEIQELCRGEGQWVVKIIISRGSGGRGYLPPENPEPNRILISYPWPDYPQDYWLKGVKIRLCTIPLAINPQLAGIKHLNRLEHVLARSEWQEPEIAEGLMLDMDGHLIEGTMSNLFLVKNNSLYTPDISRCGVAGVMRQWLIDEAEKQGIAVHITDLYVDDLKMADEVFLSNSLIGLWPVCQWGQQQYTPGSVTSALLKLLRKENVC